jgi:hypothetical protein
MTVKSTALAICQVVREISVRLGAGQTNGQSVGLQEVINGLGLDRGDVKRALLYATRLEWLAMIGRPVHSVRLLQAGREALRQEDNLLSAPVRP